jgi:hypothetical protein
MKTKQRTNKFLQTQLFLPQTQLEAFLYHLQKMDIASMMDTVGVEEIKAEPTIESVFRALIELLDAEREEYGSTYLNLKRGFCKQKNCRHAGKQGYEASSSNHDSKNKLYLIMAIKEGNILAMDLCRDFEVSQGINR